MNLKVDFMKIVRIFAHEKNRLLSMQFDNNETDEFRKAFNQWQDVEYLEQFFEEHKADLQREFYGNISIEDAIFETIEESREFEEYIRKIAKKGAKEKEPNLNDLVFKTLNKNEISLIHQKSKAYGLEFKSWLRLYAIRISADIFVVTGSAIKLTATMEEREHTKKELDKLKKTTQYLKSIGFQDADDYGFIDINN
jgi:hypothetical protein